MENQTRFDVNAAIENWRNELAAQTALSADDRRELDTHLHDLFVELKLRGLSDEESFVLARHRVGQPQKLADEFVKENPAKIWRERVFWMAIGLFAMELWGSINGSLIELFPYFFGRADVYSIMLRQTIFLLPIIGTIIFLARGRTNKGSVTWNFLLRSRWLFMIIATALFLAFALTHYFLQEHEMTLHFPYLARQFSTERLRVFLQNLIEPYLLIALITWLMPTQNQKLPKHA